MKGNASPGADALRTSTRPLQHLRTPCRAGDGDVDKVYEFRVELELVGNHIGGIHGHV
jgi:hypothetical protein